MWFNAQLFYILSYTYGTPDHAQGRPMSYNIKKYMYCIQQMRPECTVCTVELLYCTVYGSIGVQEPLIFSPFCTDMDRKDKKDRITICRKSLK